MNDQEALSAVTFVLYGSQSDAGAPGQAAGYPIPRAVRTRGDHIEGAVPGGGTTGDRHLILVARGGVHRGCAADGDALYVSGTMDPRWDNGVLNPAFHSLHANDFEVVQRGWGAPP